MKRVPIRRRSAKAQTRTLDALAREVVFARDGCCVRCGSTSHLQWAHIYSRRYRSMRWDTDNSVVFCAGCHLWWHHKPLEASAWFEDKYPRRTARLRIISQTKRKPDLEAIRLSLEQALR